MLEDHQRAGQVEEVGDDHEQPHRPVHRDRPKLPCRTPRRGPLHRCTDSAASAVVENGLRFRVNGPCGETIYTDMTAGVGGEISDAIRRAIPMSVEVESGVGELS